MGSELFTTLKTQGRNLRRGGAETIVGPPDEVAIIDVDISAEKLLALYPDDTKPHARARAIIRGVRDRTRTKAPPPDWYVATFAGGVEEPPSAANLGPDKKGRIWFAIVKGRQRTMGLREWNKRNPKEAHELTCFLAPLKHNDAAGIDAELDALEANTISNAFVAMPPSGKADHAARLKAKGRSDVQIVARIGARGTEEVQYLLALAECCEAVQESVDAGRTPLADCPALAKCDPGEQARRVARKTAGTSRKAQNGAAPPRAKTQPSRRIEAVADALEAEDLRLAIALRWAAGRMPEPPRWLEEIVQRVRQAEKGAEG